MAQSDFAHVDDHIIRVGDYIRTLDVHEQAAADRKENRRRAVSTSNTTHQARSNNSMTLMTQVSALSQGKGMKPTIKKSKRSLPSRPEIAYEPSEVIARFGADMSSPEACWTSLTRGTWLSYTERPVCYGSVLAVDAVRQIVLTSVWRRGDTYYTDQKRPIHMFPLNTVMKLSQQEFNAVCRKTYLKRMHQRLAMIKDGVDSTAPFALIDFNNGIVHDLLEQTALGSTHAYAPTLTLKDVPRARIGGAGAALSRPLPQPHAIVDPLERIRGRANEMASAGIAIQGSLQLPYNDTGDVPASITLTRPAGSVSPKPSRAPPVCDDPNARAVTSDTSTSFQFLRRLPKRAASTASNRSSTNEYWPRHLACAASLRPNSSPSASAVLQDSSSVSALSSSRHREDESTSSKLGRMVSATLKALDNDASGRVAHAVATAPPAAPIPMTLPIHAPFSHGVLPDMNGTLPQMPAMGVSAKDWGALGRRLSGDIAHVLPAIVTCTSTTHPQGMICLRPETQFFEPFIGTLAFVVLWTRLNAVTSAFTASSNPPMAGRFMSELVGKKVSVLHTGGTRNLPTAYPEVVILLPAPLPAGATEGAGHLFTLQERLVASGAGALVLPQLLQQRVNAACAADASGMNPEEAGGLGEVERFLWEEYGPYLCRLQLLQIDAQTRRAGLWGAAATTPSASHQVASPRPSPGQAGQVHQQQLTHMFTSDTTPTDGQLLPLFDLWGLTNASHRV